MARQQTASEKQFRLYERGWRKCLARNWFVLRYVGHIFWLWLTVGGSLRRAKRRAAIKGRVLYVDHIFGSGNS